MGNMRKTSHPHRDSGAKVRGFYILTKLKKDDFPTIYFLSSNHPVSIQLGMKKGTSIGRFPSFFSISSKCDLG